MQQHIALTSLLVEDYDKAIEFFVSVLGFTLVEDSATQQSLNPSTPKRWVVVAPPRSKESGILLAQPSNEIQARQIGAQAGDRVFMFLYTDDFWRDYEIYRSRGVKFVRGEPRNEPYGTVAVFVDVSGNMWDLIQPKL